ncbi:MAG: hypothetical protein OEN55_08610 [Alphaproteobacteria bacterium]|nr:hypothetical protein [Alphaproteobacteria bacterium]
MSIAIQRLRAVSHLCQRGEPLDDELAVWFGSCLRQFLERGATTFEEAFGVPSCRGGMPWWKEERVRQRDAALRALARCLPAELSASARAREIHTRAVRYAASAWRHDRRTGEMPPGCTGMARELLWRAFRSGAPMPLGERQLRNIIAGA